ncbi:MAG: hypothetical protein PUQ00_00625 [Nostoc sp. S13]|nr:hypothetical protein [Nostoc sp. S13]
MLLLYVLLQVVWFALSIISSSDRLPQNTKLKTNMLRIAYGRYNNHFPFYIQIEN